MATFGRLWIFSGAAGLKLPDPLEDSSEKGCVAGNTELVLSLKVADGRRGSVRPGGTMFKMARYPSGKGEVCKTFMRRFDSDPRLQILKWL